MFWASSGATTTAVAASGLPLELGDSSEFSFCFLMYRNLISWFRRNRTAAFMVLLHRLLFPFILMLIHFGLSSLSLHVLLNQMAATTTGPTTTNSTAITKL